MKQGATILILTRERRLFFHCCQYVNKVGEEEFTTKSTFVHSGAEAVFSVENVRDQVVNRHAIGHWLH